MGNIDSIYPGMFYRSRGKKEGVSVQILSGGSDMTQEFLTDMNAEFNGSDIYVDYYDISEIGGLGGPGADIIEIINSIDLPLKIFLGEMAIAFISNFTYDVLKTAVLKLLKRAKPEPGNHPVEIHHHTKIVVFNFNIDKTTEEDLDLQLRTLLSDVILEEKIEYDPILVDKILDKHGLG